MPAAGWSALAAGGLALATVAGRPALFLGVAVAQIGLGLGWLRLRPAETRPRIPAVAIVGIAAAGADLLCLLSAPDRLGRLAGLTGVAFVAMVFDQLLRRNRAQVTESLMQTMSAVVLVGMLAMLLASPTGKSGRTVLVVGFVGIAAGALVVAAIGRRLPAPAIGVAALAAGGAGGAAYGLLVDVPLSTAAGMGTALGTAAVAVAGLLTARTARSLPAPALLPLALAAPVSYVASRLLGG